jgi:hypothetical protein
MPQHQHQVQVHAAHTAQQYSDPHHGYVQDRSGSSLSAAMSATSAVGLHAHSLMQQQPAKPATLSKAVAGIMATPKGWQERVEKMTVLSDALNRQVCWGVDPVRPRSGHKFLSASAVEATVQDTVLKVLTARMQHGLVMSLPHCASPSCIPTRRTSDSLQQVHGSQASAVNTLLHVLLTSVFTARAAA